MLADDPVANWPEWLLSGALKTSQRKPHRVVVPDDAALARLVKTVARANPGERNSITFWAACRAGEMAASGLLSADTAAAVIAEAATRAGLPWPEAQRTARSGVSATGGHHG